MFAARQIRKGERIIAEQPLVKLGGQKNDEVVNDLSLDNQALFMELSNAFEGDPTRPLYSTQEFMRRV